jgi:putative colanic acid biosynthesis UDP-glucose lipid carrier transferase
MSFAGFGITLVLSRCMLIGALRFLRKREIFNKKVVLLGYNDLSKKLVNYFAEHHKGMSVEGYFENHDKVNELSNLPILGNIKDCIPYAINTSVSEIYSTLSPEKHDYIYEFAQHAEKHFIRFRFVPDFKLFVNRNIHVDYVADIPILSLRAEPLEDIAGRVKKRIFDVAFSLAVMVFLLSWLVPILAILIKLDSKGPVFFTQLRSGKNNRTFKCYKFRSLRANKDADAKQVTKDDKRFTRLGKFLRRTNLDELPQFFNVFLGQMSVVGPRPHMLRHTEDFSRILNKYLIRHFVKPGITGWAQVNGYRGEIKETVQLKKRIEHDIWYMENWSLWLDLRIIYLTIYATLKGDKNAY